MNKLHYLPRLGLFDTCFLIASSITTTLLGLVLPFSILIIFDRILPNNSSSSLYFIFAIILFAIFLDYKVKNLEETMVSRISNQFEKKITNQLFQAICHSNPSQFTQLETGEYLERLTTIPGLKSFFSGDLIHATINSFTCLITLLIITLINPTAGLVLIAASCLLLLISLHLSKTKVALMEKKSDIEGVTNSKVIEIISYPLDIKSRSMEYRVENLMETMIKQREHHTAEFEKQESNFNLTLHLTQQLAVIFTVVSSAIAVINLEISQGVMAAIILLTNRYFSPYQQTMRTISQWRVNKSYIQRLNDILAMEEAYHHNSAPQATPRVLSYHGTKSYHFNAEKISIVTGPSGAGKSTIVKAFTTKPSLQEVNVSVNGVQQNNYYQSTTLDNIVLIDKHSTFVDGTIIDNITCFRPQLHKAAYSLCEALAIKTDIDDLKLGFYTDITTSGIKPFSRKIHFALLIVRALLSNKKIIIIDDFDLVFDDEFSLNLLSCLRPRIQSYLFIIVSNKIKDSDIKIQHTPINEVA
ncbi:ATP-binding cassette domain-containing protein [Aliivibrio fischeri]|uniref:ABC transporter transmembrane domain-containing protein n=1 Tax=Aliivibrio fischeri TaxID=668 RepID=UPI0012D94353|nr:ABC transporter transmembrane domain-containing protein [Aliivibrio fischeri]MUK38701.1 ATP-binding cassette domain-containing protein [Aliivibrio fischeri]MUK92726.1 ATP-binding cassette domain-containing protein [Aliivibrio fischeri]MUL01703.1 ATP-binding cassette domain-containing protein [Aliivibrio fischeri]MUL04857.1 ATP-binding cassette domain-containing protein [Aliivibrio fischeri]